MPLARYPEVWEALATLAPVLVDDVAADPRYAAAGGVAAGLDGRPAAVLEALTDVTAHRAAEAALELSEAALRTALDAIPQMVWSTRADGGSDYFNRQWYAFTGLPDGEPGGAPTASVRSMPAHRRFSIAGRQAPCSRSRLVDAWRSSAARAGIFTHHVDGPFGLWHLPRRLDGWPSGLRQRS